MDYFGSAANDLNKKGATSAAAAAPPPAPDPKLLAPILSTMPPPSQMPTRFFVPEPSNLSNPMIGLDAPPPQEQAPGIESHQQQQLQQQQQPQMFIPSNYNFIALY